MTKSDVSRLMNQAYYETKIRLLEMKCTYEQFRYRRHQLAGLPHTRPDKAAEAAIIGQVIADLFQQAHITQLNRAIKRVKDDLELGRIVQQQNQKTLNIVVHADAFCAN